jgi:pyruvate/2-oxoglutarate dehydrogenase complex dihydrolipoamide acyltransferase (E2) component
MAIAGVIRVEDTRPYAVTPFPAGRRVVLDVLRAAQRRVPVHALVEYDVTEASRRMAHAPQHVSWTGFVIGTLARAVALHPGLNCRRAGHWIVRFDRVDIAATVEHVGAPDAAPTPVTIHSADRMSPAQITAALSEAKRDEPAPGPASAALLWRLPGPFRRGAMRLVGGTPRGAASFGPCVGVTSLGMLAGGGGWAVPVAPLTVVVTVGAVLERPVALDGLVVVRARLPMTLSFDHVLVDGAPAARFAQTLRTLVERADVLTTHPDGEAHGDQPAALPQ